MTQSPLVVNARSRACTLSTLRIEVAEDGLEVEARLVEPTQLRPRHLRRRRKLSSVCTRADSAGGRRAGAAPRPTTRTRRGPGRSATELPLRPGSDVALMNGPLAYCSDNGAGRSQPSRRARAHPRRVLGSARRQQDGGWDLRSTATACDLPVSDLLAFCTSCSRGTSAPSRCSARGSTSRSAAPTRSTRSSTCTLPPGASASLGRHRSRSPASLTRWAGARSAGSPSALAAHRGFAPENTAEVRRFWAAPRMAGKPGLKAVDLFHAVGEGRVKALWVMATNPAVSLPDAAQVRARWPRARRVVVSGLHGRDRHRALRRTSSCPRSPGVRRTAR